MTRAVQVWADGSRSESTGLCAGMQHVGAGMAVRAAHHEERRREARELAARLVAAHRGAALEEPAAPASCKSLRRFIGHSTKKRWSASR